MAVVIQNETDPGYGPAIAFLSGQQQYLQQQQAQGPSPVEQAALAAMQAAADQQAAQQQLPGMPGAAPVAVGPGGYGGHHGGGGGDGAAFLAQQSHAAGLASAEQARADALAQHQQAIAERQAAAQQAKLQQQQQQQVNQQQLAELNANLKYVNQVKKTAPGLLDPAQIASVQSKIQANQDALTYPARAARFKLQQAIATGNPDAIKEGLAQGLLSFTPEQENRIKQLKEADAQIDLDASLNPYQRSIGHRQMADKLAGIQPQMVPDHQQPIDPIEQYHKDTITLPHPTLGIPITKEHAPARNGEEGGWRITKESLEDVKAEYKRRDNEHKLDLHASETAAKQAQAQIDHQSKLITAKINAHTKLFALRQQLAQAQIDAATPTKEGEAPAVSQEQLKAIKNQISELEGNISELDNLSAMPQGSMPTVAGQPDEAMQQAEGDWITQQQPQQSEPSVDDFTSAAPPVPPQGDQPDLAMQQADANQIAPPLSPHEDGAQQWNQVPINGTVTLPNGDIVRKTGPTSFVRIQ
jgi:hypothetical protein